MSHRMGQPRLSHARSSSRVVSRHHGGSLAPKVTVSSGRFGVWVGNGFPLRRFFVSRSVRTGFVQSCPPDMSGHVADKSGHDSGHGKSGFLAWEWGSDVRRTWADMTLFFYKPSVFNWLVVISRQNGGPPCPDMQVCARDVLQICARPPRASLAAYYAGTRFRGVTLADLGCLS